MIDSKMLCKYSSQISLRNMTDGPNIHLLRYLTYEKAILLGDPLAQNILTYIDVLAGFAYQVEDDTFCTIFFWKLLSYSDNCCTVSYV